MMRRRQGCGERRSSHRRLLLLVVDIRFRDALDDAADFPLFWRGSLRNRERGSRIRSASMLEVQRVDNPLPVRASDDVSATDACRLVGARLLVGRIAARFTSIRCRERVLSLDEPDLLRSSPSREEALHRLRALEPLSDVRWWDSLVLTTDRCRQIRRTQTACGVDSLSYPARLFVRFGAAEPAV